MVPPGSPGWPRPVITAAVITAAVFCCLMLTTISSGTPQVDRRAGLTMVIDGGLPPALFADLMSSTAEYVDFVKFGWGTAVVTGSLAAKIEP